MNPLVQSALISTGGNIIGSFLSRKSNRKANAFATDDLHYRRSVEERNRAQDLAFRDSFLSTERAREDSAVRRRVADAKAAGIHPVYALGMSGTSGMSAPAVGGSAFSEAPSIYEQDTGSLAGDVFSALSDGVSGYYQAKAQQVEQERERRSTERVRDAQVKSAEARAKRDEAEAALALSQVARAAQSVNSRRQGDAVTVIPAGQVPGDALTWERRPHVVEPRFSKPAMFRMHGPSGPDHYPYMPQGDELNQAIWALNRMVEGTAWTRGRLVDAGMWLRNLLRGEK